MKIYFGYDESNNNQIPEFHLLTFSTNVKTVQTPKFKLVKGKNRKEKFENITTDLIEKQIDFRFLILFKEDYIKINQIIKENKLREKDRLKFKKALVLYSLFSELNFENSKFDLFLDGFIGNSKQTKEVINFLVLNFKQISGFRNIQQGDIKLEIINFADRIAYQFLNEYNNMGMYQFNKYQNSLINRLIEKRIFPKFDNNFLEFMK